MNAATPQVKSDGVPPRQRSLDDFWEPLERQARSSGRLLAEVLGRFDLEGQTYSLRRFLFRGPKGGDDPVNLGLLAGLCGDDPSGAYALVDLLSFLESHPDWARGYHVHVYPVCNPTGFEDNTRWTRRNIDLLRAFWKNSSEPEVQILENELRTRSFQGLITLQADTTSDGVYAATSSSTLARHVIESALTAAEAVLPRNRHTIIDGLRAREGIIIQRKEDLLRGPPQARPQPFEIWLKAPQAAPQFLQQKAFLASLLGILMEYQKFLAYSVNL